MHTMHQKGGTPSWTLRMWEFSALGFKIFIFYFWVQFASLCCKHWFCIVVMFYSDIYCYVLCIIVNNDSALPCFRFCGSKKITTPVHAISAVTCKLSLGWSDRKNREVFVSLLRCNYESLCASFFMLVNINIYSS